jgi:hypothetical protein
VGKDGTLTDQTACQPKEVDRQQREGVTLAFQRRYGDLPIAYDNCKEPDDIEVLLETLSQEIVVEADGVVWQAFRADIRAGASGSRFA